jgi:hypothetical protein
VDPGRTGPDSFFASDATDARFFIEGSVRAVGGERVLSFIVVARLPDGNRGRVCGREFFAAMMAHFGPAGVDVIEGQWETTNPDWTTNLDAFNRVTGSTSEPEAVAAGRVPTGRYAAGAGYTNVTVVTANPPGARGRYTEVLVRFRR